MRHEIPKEDGLWIELDEYEIIARWLLHTHPGFASEPEFIARGPAWLRQKLPQISQQYHEEMCAAAHCIGEYFMQQVERAQGHKVRQVFGEPAGHA